MQHAPKCDGCGRFCRPAKVVGRLIQSMNDNPDYDERVYCAPCWERRS